MMRLLWKPFSNDAVPPVFLKQRKKPEMKPDKVNISLFLNGWCPAQNMTYERTKRAINDFKEKVEVNEYRTIDKDVQREWGISDAVMIDGKHVRTGPPPSYEKIRRLIERRIKRLS